MECQVGTQHSWHGCTPLTTERPNLADCSLSSPTFITCHANCTAQALSSAKHEQCGLTTALQAAKQQADDARATAEAALVDCKQAAAAALDHAAAEMAQLRQQAAEQLQAAQEEAQQLHAALAAAQQQLEAEAQQSHQLQQRAQETQQAQAQQLQQLQQAQQEATQHLERVQALQAENVQLTATAYKRYVLLHSLCLKLVSQAVLTNATGMLSSTAVKQLRMPRL